MPKVITGINVRANQVINHGDGVFTILIEGEELPPETLKTIRDLFPHTGDKVMDLLSVENTLSAIVHDYVPKENEPSHHVKAKKAPF